MYQRGIAFYNILNLIHEFSSDDMTVLMWFYSPSHLCIKQFFQLSLSKTVQFNLQSLVFLGPNMGDVNTDAQSPLKKRPKIEADANEGGEKFAVPDREISNWSMMERLFSYSQPQPSTRHDDNEVNEAADSEAPFISNRENMGSNVNPSVLFSFSQPVGPVEEFFLSNTNGTGTMCSQTPMSQRRAGKSMMLTRLVCRMTRFCVKTSKFHALLTAFNSDKKYL